MGSEFMPPLDEGDLLYMPTALPGLSVGKAGELLQQTDRIIKSFPEVATVFGKVGRAESATDPAPLEMVETTIRFKPRKEWRPGVTRASLLAEMDAALRIPGVANVWVPQSAIVSMLATGIKSPVGIKMSSISANRAHRAEVEALVRDIPGTSSAFSSAPRRALHRDTSESRRGGPFRLMETVDVTSLALGTKTSATVRLQRFPISVRYPRELRFARGFAQFDRDP
jgi:Cu(I)/Ag(I) efflux system membrane protein CusA/SilA